MSMNTPDRLPLPADCFNRKVQDALEYRQLCFNKVNQSIHSGRIKNTSPDLSMLSGIVNSAVIEHNQSYLTRKFN